MKETVAVGDMGRSAWIDIDQADALAQSGAALPEDLLGGALAVPVAGFVLGIIAVGYAYAVVSGVRSALRGQPSGAAPSSAAARLDADPPADWR